MIGDDIELRVLTTHSGRVRLGFTAPEGVAINRVAQAVRTTLQDQEWNEKG